MSLIVDCDFLTILFSLGQSSVLWDQPCAANTPLLCCFTAPLIVRLPLGAGEGKGCCCSSLSLMLLTWEMWGNSSLSHSVKYSQLLKISSKWWQSILSLPTPQPLCFCSCHDHYTSNNDQFFGGCLRRAKDKEKNKLCTMDCLWVETQSDGRTLIWAQIWP